MTEHGSVSVTSELEPSVAPATVVTSHHGDIDMTEFEPSGSQPCDGSTHKESTDYESTGNEKNVDQLSGNQPSSNQPNSDQPTDDQPMCDQSTDYQPNGDQLTDGQPMGDQPTDNKSTDAIYTEVSLIAEVQKNPLIFNEDYKEYFKQEAKRKEWENVCEGLFPQWSTFSPSKKKEISREVQNKWTKIREPFFKSYGGIQKRLTHAKNVERSFDFLNSTHELDEIIAERKAQEHARNHQEENARKDQNASYNHEEYARKEQNASREEEHVHGMNPTPEKIPVAEIPEILEQPVAISNSAQFNENQGHISVISTAAVPSTSAQFNENLGHISVIPTAALPSTSAQFNENQGHIPEMQTTSAQNNQGQNYLVMPSPSADHNISCASFLCAMLDNLNYHQQCAVWPNLVALLSYASKSKPKKIKILQGELLTPGDYGATRMPATGPEIILQESFTDPELEGQEPFAGPELVVEEPYADPELVAREPFADSGLVAKETFADPELGNQQALAEKQVDQETMTELDDAEECIYPSSHGRPTNAQGEIIYPETDHEDLDED